MIRLLDELLLMRFAGGGGRHERPVPAEHADLLQFERGGCGLQVLHLHHTRINNMHVAIETLIQAYLQDQRVVGQRLVAGAHGRAEFQRRGADARPRQALQAVRGARDRVLFKIE